MNVKPLFLLLFFPLQLSCANNEKYFRRAGESFYKNLIKPPINDDSPIGKIENIICPALEIMSRGPAKRTIYFPPLESKKPN